MSVRGEEWTDPGSGLPERTITDALIYEVSLCPAPAYKSTTAVLTGRSENHSAAQRRLLAKAEAAMRLRGIG